jgi:uncharacterized protein YndB with AHSA1/START domain
MSTVRALLPHPSERVMDVLLDPITYPEWLVGCLEIRAIDGEWPAPGSRFHHRFGIVGPVAVEDYSEVMAVAPRRLLQLEVRAHPMGRGQATFTVEPTSPTACSIELAEVPIGLLAPARPVLDPLTARRNRRTLANLERFLQ